MHTVSEIVGAFGGPTEFGRVCGWTENPSARGGDILRRGSIPVRYWPSIVKAAKERCIAVDNDVLVDVHTLEVAE